MSSQVPLPTMLSWAWIAHTIEADNAFEAASRDRAGRAFRISVAMWTNGLRFIDEAGTTVAALRDRARAACNVGGLERWGWIEVGEPSGRRRDGYGSHRGVNGDTVLRPTRAGSYARRLWPQVVADTEQRWRDRFGGDAIDALRAALLELATPMPWSPPEVHASDGFLTHPLTGTSAEDDAERPLLALLGQVLTGLALDHEHKARVSLPLSANVLRAVDEEVVRCADLTALTGLSKEGIAMATGFMLRSGMAEPAPERALRLSADGLEALGQYRRLAAAAKSPPLRGALEAVLVRRDALSAGLVPPDGCWRAEKPYLNQTRRLVADPTAALPWHPMVLHRGGWPDAC